MQKIGKLINYRNKIDIRVERINNDIIQVMYRILKE